MEYVAPSPDSLAFWRENHVCTLTTTRPDGSPHVVPVGVTYDPEAGAGARHRQQEQPEGGQHPGGERGRGSGPGVDAGAGASGGARVAVCQVQRRRWATLEGRATIRTEPEVVADAVSRYAERYERTPAPNPDRVVIEIAVDRALGRG